MKIQNAYKLIVVAVVAAGVIGVAIAQERTRGINRVGPNPPPLPTGNCARGDCDYLGMVGITRGQTARLNAYDKSTVDNPADVSTQNNVTDVPPGPCRQVQLMFFDSQGNIQQRSTQCLLPGHAVFLDLNGNSLEVPGLRAEIRGLVQFQNDGATNVGATLEVFDSETGRTSFVLLPAVQKNTWAGR